MRQGTILKLTKAISLFSPVISVSSYALPVARLVTVKWPFLLVLLTEDINMTTTSVEVILCPSLYNIEDF